MSENITKAPPVKPKYNWREHVTNAFDLQHQTFPPVSYVVNELVPEGLTIIAARPKFGKSWIALDIVLAATEGGKCLDRTVTPSKVLYCAMEDNKRRMKRRIEKLRGNDGEWPIDLEVAYQWRRLDAGGLDDLNEWANSKQVEGEEQPKLIVVLDTWQRVKPAGNGSYQDDYSATEPIHRWASDNGIAVIIIHHERKMAAVDPIDTLSGTLGFPGVADTIIVMNGSSSGKTLYVRGRDIEEATHAIAFDKETCRWSILGNAVDVGRSKARKNILEILLNAKEPLGPKAIAMKLRPDIDDEVQLSMYSNTVRQRLNEMYKANEVEKLDRGLYVHPDRTNEFTVH